MMSSASTVIDRLLAAMNALDVDGFVSCYASSATIEDGEDSRNQSLVSVFTPILSWAEGMHL
jgi:hypothetical protein